MKMVTQLVIERRWCTVARDRGVGSLIARTSGLRAALGEYPREDCEILGEGDLDDLRSLADGSRVHHRAEPLPVVTIELHHRKPAVGCYLFDFHL